MKTKILGTSFTLTSKIKMEEIVKLKKFSPESLVMKDDKGVVKFGIGIGEAAINSAGITFNGSNAEDFAQVTMGIPTEVEDKAKYVADNYGLALIGLTDMEKHIELEMAGLAAKFNKITESIEVVE